MASPSSSQDPLNPLPLQALPSSSTVSRRLPPPCWSHDETVALIDAYREKWYSLRRGNLRANHWQEVADAVAARCPLTSGNPQKTSVQCRHKMEKLRKRYRAEIQRVAATPSGRNRYNSSWVHFKRMDEMEKGPTVVPLQVIPAPIEEEEDDDDEEEDDDEEDYQENLYPQMVKNGNFRNGLMGNVDNGNEFRSRVPGWSNMVSPQPSTAMYNKYKYGF